MNDRHMENDEALASLMGVLAEQYRKQIEEQAVPKNNVRLDVVRKLNLIADSIKGLMKPRQREI
jgi:undecaprenyl pyrophosphate synthase